MFGRLAQNLALSLLGLCFCVVVVEVALRVIEGAAPADAPPGASDSTVVAARPLNAPLYLPSDDLGWQLAPDTVQVFRRVGVFDTTVRSNALGLRGRPVASRPDSVRRLVVLGDSYGFGWGVEAEDTYARQLERILNRRAPPGQTVEVVNGALPGFGTFQRRRALERLLPFGVDGVIIEFSVSNDVVDDWRARTYVPDELGRYQAEGTVFPAFERFLERHLRTARFLRQRLMPLRLWLEQRRSPNLERTHGLLSELVEACQERKLPVVLVINASRYQVFGTDAGLMGAVAQTGFSHRPNELVRAVGADLGVPVIDGEAAFRAAQGFDLYLEGDAHWTPAGHRIVAEALAVTVTEVWGGP